MNKLMLMLALFFLAFPALAQLNEQQLKEYEARLAVNPNDQEALLKLGIHYHNRSGDGDEKVVDKAVDFLDRLLQLNNRNTVAMAFYGSAVTMPRFSIKILLRKVGAMPFCRGTK